MLNKKNKNKRTKKHLETQRKRCFLYDRKKKQVSVTSWKKFHN